MADWPTRRMVTAGVASTIVAASAQYARADGAVDLQLVLAVDTSGSVNRHRFELQRNGYADAFRAREVQRAILGGRARAVAVIMSHWTGPGLQEVALAWTRLASIDDCQAYAAAIDAAPRRLFAGGTSLSGAIDHGRALFASCPFGGTGTAGPRRVIDVSGDGPNNRGRPPKEARDDAVAADITINGLPILAIEPDLDRYYAEHVVGGPGAFLVPAETFETFGEAVRRKLLQEIAADSAAPTRGA